MSSILNQLRASGGTDAIIFVLEIKSPSMLESIVICNGFQDLQVVFENGENRTAIATGMDVALPKKDATGAQMLRFAISNVRGQAIRIVRAAIDAQEEIEVVARQYVSSDLFKPAENPLHMIARTITTQGDAIDIIAGFFDVIDTQFPRDVYNSDFAPGLKYYD